MLAKNLLLFGTRVDGDASGWAATVIANGGTVSSGRLAVVTSLVQSLKVAGVWSLLDRLWLFAAENETQAKTCIKSRQAVSLAGTANPVFTANRGYKGDGVNARIDSNFNAFTAGGNFQQNSAAHGVWVETAPTVNSGFEIVNNFGAYSFIMAKNGASFRWAVNSVVNSEIVGPNAGTLTGLLLAERTGASAEVFWRNDAQFFTGTSSGILNANQNHGILANIGGSNPSDARLAAAFIGGSMAGKEAAFYQAMRSYMSAVGVTVERTDVDPHALAHSLAVVANGGTVSEARLQLVSTFIGAEKSSGAWALTDEYWALWGEGATQALTSLKYRRLASAVNSPTFTANRGYASDGLASYVNAGFVPSTQGVAMNSTNLRIAAYERTNLDEGSYAAAVQDSADANLNIRPRFGASAFINTNSAGVAYTLPAATSLGYTSGSRNGAGAAQCAGYKNGVAMVQGASTTFGSTMATRPLFIGGRNNTGSADALRATQVSFVCIGASLSAAQELAQYNAVQAWATAIGANV